MQQYDLSYRLRPAKSGLACLLLYLRPRSLITLFFVALAVFLFCGFLSVATQGWDGLIRVFGAGTPFTTQLLLPVLAICLSMPLLMAIFSAIVVLASRNSGKWDYRILVSEAALEGRTSVVQTQFQWSAFERLVVIGNLAYLMLASGGTVLLPRRALPNSADWPALLEAVRYRLSHTGA